MLTDQYLSFFVKFIQNFCPVFSWVVCLFNIKLQASLVAQLVKNPPAMQETLVPPLGWEDSLEEGMATHSSILAWRIPMDRGAWWATAHGLAKSQTLLAHSLYSLDVSLLCYTYFANHFPQSVVCLFS